MYKLTSKAIKLATILSFSLLFNIPGEPWSVATIFDGYPMSKQGNLGIFYRTPLVGSIIALALGLLAWPLLFAAMGYVRKNENS